MHGFAVHPEVHFAGAQSGEALVRYYAAADVMVMPSRTETFGLVLLEAMACGVPVAAFPSAGPTDVIGDSGAGVIDEDLGRAARAALDIRCERCLTCVISLNRSAQHTEVLAKAARA